MSYYYSVIKDKPVGFWKIDESSGNSAYDSSGCGNTGTYTGSIKKAGMPLVAGGKHSNKIDNYNYIQFAVTKDFSGQTGKGGFGILNTGDNDFSLEVWFHAKSLVSYTPVFADTDGIGIYWDNGNIVFKLENERLDYTPYYPDKYFHVVAVYTGSVMKLYINGQIVKTKNTGKINFVNESLTFQCGPTSTNEYFVVDAPAIYRYALNDNQIINHYYGAQINSETQIALSDYGKIFKATEKHQPETEKFIYPISKNWQYFTNDDLSYNESENSIYLQEGSSYGEFTQTISLLYWKQYVSSKIEWQATKGVNIYTSKDAINWHLCTNGSIVEGITASDTKIIFIKVTFTSSNSQLYTPKMKSLGIYFYDDKKLYAHNGAETIIPFGGVVSANVLENQSSDPIMIATVTDIEGENNYASINTETVQFTGADVDFSNKEFSVLSRYPDNGIKTRGNGFYTNTEDNIYNIELIFTPIELGIGYLIYNNNVSETLLFWDEGQITKSNISSLYINGQNVSNQNNISDYIYINEPNHIVIKTLEPVSGQIFFNLKYKDGEIADILPNNLYKNISIYQGENIDPVLHYNLYTGHDAIEVSGSVIQVTEEAIKTYSKDWVIVNNA